MNGVYIFRCVQNMKGHRMEIDETNRHSNNTKKIKIYDYRS